MPADAALLEVESVSPVAGRAETLVRARIRTGAIRAGMQTKLIFTRGLFVYAEIKSVEQWATADGTRQVELVVETSREDAGVPWQGLCTAGALVTVEDMAGRPREPAI